MKSAVIRSLQDGSLRSIARVALALMWLAVFIFCWEITSNLRFGSIFPARDTLDTFKASVAPGALIFIPGFAWVLGGVLGLLVFLCLALPRFVNSFRGIEIIGILVVLAVIAFVLLAMMGLIGSPMKNL